MVKFNDMKYVRPNLDEVKVKVSALLETLKTTNSEDEFFNTMDKIDEIESNLYTMATLSSIRNSINTKDEFYDKEEQFWNENSPYFSELATTKAKIILDSNFKEAISKKYGSHLLEKYEVALKTYKPEIAEDLVVENKLKTEYQKLTAGSEVTFRGEKKTIPQMAKHTVSTDRDERREANEVIWGWYNDNIEKLDSIFDELVKVRHGIGKKLGYENFIPVAYARLGRTDWDTKDAKNYRKQIEEYVVPLTQKLIKEQGERIGIKDMKYYDFPLAFLSGNPTPKGEEEYLVKEASKMYNELSPETAEFFKVMVDCDLMDLTNKPGKAPGGYMTSIPDFRVPFIFSNFNGTQGDVDVLTHEAGHAFQGYVVRDVRPMDLTSFTQEVAEVHSMSMEYFTHPWMKNFFGDDTEKYYYAHVVDSLKFLPYGASIDEFQEWVYQNVDATPEQRRNKYREIERKYLPHVEYEGCDYLQNGGKWQRQLHVYLMPFYYLDYTLSQVCAFQYFIWDMKNHEEAWNSYLEICRLGGRVPFKKLAPQVGLKSPFVDGTIASITPELEKYLDSLDKSKIK